MSKTAEVFSKETKDIENPDHREIICGLVHQAEILLFEIREKKPLSKSDIPGMVDLLVRYMKDEDCGFIGKEFPAQLLEEMNKTDCCTGVALFYDAWGVTKQALSKFISSA